jgi:hypothetical protein
MNNIKIFTFVLRRILDKIAFEKLLKELKEKYLFSDDFRYLKTFPYQEDKRDIDDIYVDITIIEHYPLKMSENLISNSTRDGKTRALIYGRAGVGNTTLSKYLSHKWAKDELLDEFDLVIYLPLRDWEGDSLKKNILKYYFPVEKEDLDIDIEDIKKRKTLFIFDGYDELKEEYKRDFRKILEGLDNYIITSRPYGFYQDEFNVNETFENIGFTDENVEEYIRKYFKDDEGKANRLIKGIKSNINIYQVAHIPLMLELICSISKEEEQDFSDLTITDLYKKVVDNIFKGHIAKNRDKEISRKERKKVLNILGKLAFEGLKKQRIIFDEDFIEKVLEDEEIEFLEGKAILSGFLKTDKKNEELLDNNLEFVHLTFQEYLSAYYVSNLDKEEIRGIIRDYKFYPHMQVFFMFLAGLIDDKNFLIKEIKSEPRDILGFYEILFLMSLLSQIRPEELDEKLFEEFKRDLFKWIEFTIMKKIQYEKLLENLPLIKEYIKDKNVYVWVRRNVAIALINIERNNSSFINKHIYVFKVKNICEDKNIYVWVKENVAVVIILINIEKNNKNIDRLIAKNLTLAKYLRITNVDFKKNVVNLDFLFLYGIYRALPFYLKENNILHIIFEEKELKIKKVSKKK